MNKNAMPDGVFSFDYTVSNAKAPDINSIPVLVNKETMAVLTNGDDSPFFKVESIDFPARGTGGVYEKSFFQSFLNVMKQRPIPGSKRGHEYTSRPASDFYTVGGMIENGADSKSGTAHFLVYIPKKGDPTDNSGFIRDAMANIVHFSLVSAPEYNIQKDKETGYETRHFIKSNGYERNDAVEYGAGAMAQTVNSKQSIDFEQAGVLVSNGHFTRSDKDGEIIQNGKVSYPVLRRMVSNADCENKAEIAELISAIDKQSNGGKPVELKEAIDIVGVAVKNGQAVFADIAKNAGCEKLIRNADDEANAKLVENMKKKLGDDPERKVDVILAENAANAEAIVKNKVSAVFGAEKNGEVQNNAYAYAMMKCANKVGTDLDTAIEACKADPIMVGIKASQADVFSVVNSINAEKQKNETASAVATY